MSGHYYLWNSKITRFFWKMACLDIFKVWVYVFKLWTRLSLNYSEKVLYFIKRIEMILMLGNKSLWLDVALLCLTDQKSMRWKDFNQSIDYTIVIDSIVSGMEKSCHVWRNSISIKCMRCSFERRLIWLWNWSQSILNQYHVNLQ